MKRRGGDSNPGYGFDSYTLLSKTVAFSHSATFSRTTPQTLFTNPKTQERSSCQVLLK